MLKYINAQEHGSGEPSAIIWLTITVNVIDLAIQISPQLQKQTITKWRTNWGVGATFIMTVWDWNMKCFPHVSNIIKFSGTFKILT